MINKITALGLMSGSSLDGLDVCLADFSMKEHVWHYQILDAYTIPFSSEIEHQLSVASTLNENNLHELDLDFGNWIGNELHSISAKSEVIGLHGHTVRHEPKNGISYQLGSGRIVAQKTKKPTVVNFRMADILLGGEGAPLVPMGEKLLFPSIDGFLNLGGICNASVKVSKDDWQAGDIGPFNQVLNFYSKKLGQAFDDKGKLARRGEVQNSIVDQWRALDFFSKSFPKSLSNDWVQRHFFGVKGRPENILKSFIEFICGEIVLETNRMAPSRLLITGGGAFNDFALELIQQKSKAHVILPSKEIILFKEALIFGLLGVLRINDIPNVISSCTGASKDSCAGDIYSPA